MRAVQRKCDRARQWASLELDGELSSFELALLENHVAGCASCAEFRTEINGLTSALRAAPYEPFQGVVLARVRRNLRLRLAPAAAAMAVAAVGLGSILASASFRGSSVGHIAQRVGASPAAASVTPNPDTMNLSTSVAIKTLRARTAAHIAPRSRRSLRGGPVVGSR
ncbi:MAG TPA: zf-HC2 domain-containing protein [Gaiellaceae bacterium]|nr:zf-HC2 domain-containing protein [Gaiellaceae bacterium]